MSGNFVTGEESPDNLQVTLRGPHNSEKREAVAYLFDQLREVIAPKHRINIQIEAMPRREYGADEMALALCDKHNGTYIIGDTQYDLVLSKIRFDSIFAQHHDTVVPDCHIYWSRKYKWHSSHRRGPAVDAYDFTTAMMHEIGLHGICHDCTGAYFQISVNEDFELCAHWKCGLDEQDEEEGTISRWMQMIAFECEDGTFPALWSLRADPVKLYQVLRYGRLFFRRTLNDENQYVPENVVQLLAEETKINGHHAYTIEHFHPRYEGTPNGAFCKQIHPGFQQVELPEAIKKIVRAMSNLHEIGPQVSHNPASLKPQLDD